MKKIFVLLCIMVLVLNSCKNEAKNRDGTPTADRPTESKAASDDGDMDSEINVGGEEIEIDMGGMMGAVGGILNKGGKEDSSEEGMFTTSGQLNIEYLKSDAGIPMRKAFAKMAEVTEAEVDLVLSLPALENASNICSVYDYQIYMKQASDPRIQAYVDIGEASQGFLNIIDEYRKSAEEYEQELIRRTKHEKNMFLVRNKSWQGLAEDSLENGYIDSRQKLVYLPLGDLSFADSVIDFQPGKPEGRTPENSLGPPESIAPDAILDCASLAAGGVLTLYFEDNAIIDINGPDIYVFELGVIEPTNLKISKDGQNWIDIGQISAGTASIDIKEFAEKGEVYHYVRFTDLRTDSAIPGADIDAVAAIGGAMRMTLNNALLFEAGSHILKKEGRDAIAALRDKMASIKMAKITIEGHTDEGGDSASNKTLSEKRAASVRQELQKVIANSEHTWVEVGFGESQPIAPNDSDENRQKNRRVEILVTPS